MFYDVFVKGTRSLSQININGYCMAFHKAVTSHWPDNGVANELKLTT